MTDLLAARWQMALSLGFHIIFAAIGMAMPFFMAVSHWFWLRTGQRVYLDLTKSWSKGVAIFFATGAVSGTALSFELGLLWPEFMKHAGPIIGMPFSWEGAAFFVEAIALGLFLYGWQKIPPWWHWFTGLVVGFSGVLSAYFVICANAWMNSPTGFDLTNGTFTNIDPWAAMFNSRSLDQAAHMIIASFVAVGFAVAGVHALQLLRYPENLFHKKAVVIALTIGSLAALIQPISGDITAKMVARFQPLKLAAMEAHFDTEKHAPLVIGGWPSVAEGRTNYALKIPGLLSYLAHGDFETEVRGLHDFDRKLWPPVLITHIAFQTMVAIGTLLAGFGALFLLIRWRRPRMIWNRKFLRLCVGLMPLGFIAIEAGWTVTEVGRQPWIIYGIMKTADALTPMPGLIVTLAIFAVVYLLLAGIVFWLMRRQIAVVNRQEPSTGGH